MNLVETGENTKLSINDIVSKGSIMNAEPITMADVDRVLGKELKQKEKITDNPVKGDKK